MDYGIVTVNDSENVINVIIKEFFGKESDKTNLEKWRCGEKWEFLNFGVSLNSNEI